MSLPSKTSEENCQPGFTRLMSLSDEALVMHLRDGHPDALAVLFDRYHRLVLSVALRILRDPGEAEDVMQSVFLEILGSAAQFDASRGTTKVWILQYAYHRGLNRRRSLNLRRFHELTEDSPFPATVLTSPEKASLGMLESAQLVQEALSRLNKLQKRTLELAFFEGLTMHEIAEKTGKSFASVRHHYYRGLEKLRSLLCASSNNRKKSESPRQEVAHVKA